MNVDHTKFVIPITAGNVRYQITVQVENPLSNTWHWYAIGADYKDPMMSPMGWGDTPEEAVEQFINNFIKFDGPRWVDARF